MRSLLSILLVLMAGCASTETPATLPPSKPGDATPVDAYADHADKVMDKAAAAVAVAQEANTAGKPAVVESELSVASNLLPRPQPVEIAAARQRAASSDPAVYTLAIIEADRLQRKLDELWGSVEAEKQKARSQLDAKQAELEAERAKARDLLWTIAGLALSVAGAAGFVWGSAFGVTKPEAGAVVLCGFAVGSLPWLLDSELSAWVIAPAAALVALRGVVWVWSKGWRKPKPQPPADFFRKEPQADAKAEDRIP